MRLFLLGAVTMFLIPYVYGFLKACWLATQGRLPDYRKKR